ncbi:non-hydrolyzing UDP-N-acetylglucosamine 2-epimerase [Bradyrhizobium sp.]|uniref:non-hydrolyzing UDP-N-acetylglucosamine 2-epimerase n=1 Tax=Bradyrhizobium sp. TaxID=376 RepID=UPI003C364F3E
MRFLCVVGTRPEAIKLAPVILQLSKYAQVTTICSGQHSKLARKPLEWFGIKPDGQIALRSKARTLAKLTGAMFVPLERMISKYSPDVIIAQGDTTTVLVAALTAFYVGVPFAHVEAGLRTGDLNAPFPEEFNRITADRLARWHFCPTKRACDNLRAEGIEQSRLYITGNTGIDALRLTLDRANEVESHKPSLRRILLTAHRRENQGECLEEICRAVIALVDVVKDLEIRIPMHPSPGVRDTFERLCAHRDRVTLLPPLNYEQLVFEMCHAELILTDSGGIQEEAPYLRKPVLVLRDKTERPEAVELGVARLVGARRAEIVRATRELLANKIAYAKMASGASPYGDGYAAERIGAAFGLCATPVSAK